jgi:hypothetical protein
MNYTFDKGTRYITCGVVQEVPEALQYFMWSLIEDLMEHISLDYLQIFRLEGRDGKQLIVHEQEQPEYEKEYVIDVDSKPILAKIYVIDDIQYSTMLLSKEY